MNSVTVSNGTRLICLIAALIGFLTLIKQRRVQQTVTRIEEK